jgi:UDP-N-acetylglucosamine 3-dehydrogenase
MIKLGVIGIGSMGKNHVRVCSEIENIELVGLADIDKTAAQKVAERFDISAFFDYKELLQKVDAIIVSTPTKLHYSIVLDALNEGKHVLVEKPMCDDVKKAEELVKKANKEKLVLAVGHIERHNPAVKFVQASINNKQFGELITLGSKRVSNFPGRVRDTGVIFDLGIHDIDVMRFLAGNITSVYARTGRFTKTINFEDHANIVLNFENGICGVVEVNWLTPMKVRKLFLTCSKNFVEVDYTSQIVTISSSSFKTLDEMNLYRTPLDYNINQVALEKKEPLRNEIEDFISAIDKGGKPLASGEDGVMAIRIAQAAVESSKIGKEVKL